MVGVLRNNLSYKFHKTCINTETELWGFIRRKKRHILDYEDNNTRKERETAVTTTTAQQ